MTATINELLESLTKAQESTQQQLVIYHLNQLQSSEHWDHAGLVMPLYTWLITS